MSAPAFIWFANEVNGVVYPLKTGKFGGGKKTVGAKRNASNSAENLRRYGKSRKFIRRAIRAARLRGDDAVLVRLLQVVRP